MPLDMRWVSVIDAFPVYECTKKVLTIGCGTGILESHLHKLGYDVLATDIQKQIVFKEQPGLKYRNLNILDPDFSLKRPIVLCCQVLEHLKKFKLAVKNLLNLTEVRLILTFPFRNSFWSPSHKNFWADSKKKGRDVNEFKILCAPFSTSISKIRTKPEDAPKKWCYLVVVDKRQPYS